MAKKLKAGDVVNGYTVTKVFGPGMMAISYGATSPSGGKVFLKQYKSPSTTVVWYKSFVAYQSELARRVNAGKASHYAVRHIDSFEAHWGGRSYFQAYEFVENGADLEQLLEQERQTRSRGLALDVGSWQRHVTWSKVLLAGVQSLHDSKIVHADLKPANAYMVRDLSIAAGYQLKLIDMDFSLLQDIRAPWHGFQGYVGTDNYRSPEHMKRGEAPGPWSDVFTCGLMLYELLAGFHPYWREDQDDYARMVLSHEARAPALLGRMPGDADDALVSAALYRCLSPDPTQRPNVQELRAVLGGKISPTPDATRHADGPAGNPAAAPILAEALEINGPNGRTAKIRVRTVLGKTLLEQFGPGSDFWDQEQCVLRRTEARQWVIEPLANTTNDTLVNGQALNSPRILREGDEIAVGRQAKGVVKAPLIVSGVK